jgi:hypothetical protein
MAPVVLCRAFHSLQFQGARPRNLAYNSADEHIRVEFDNITSAMTSILTAVGDAMREVKQDKTRATLSNRPSAGSSRWWRWPAGIINGGSEADVDYIMNH